jgi:predicted house-cleaning noncanonical NTP pyrophosphatase (MazG superfamily)
MPKADRRSNTIPNEVWEAFGAAYIDQMPGLTGKSQTAVSSAVQVYLKKFSMFKTNKPVLEKLKEQLGLFIENGKDIEQFADILELLTTKVETYLKADEAEQLAANL